MTVANGQPIRRSGEMIPILDGFRFITTENDYSPEWKTAVKRIEIWFEDSIQASAVRNERTGEVQIFTHEATTSILYAQIKAEAIKELADRCLSRGWGL
jgi:hypothetical protein